MDVCILHPDGELMLHRHMPASPEPFLKALAPSREDSVVAVEGMVTWSWLAALCAPHGSAVVRGHALSMKAMHGGKAQHDTLDAHTIAVLLRGGLLPQAYVYPAALRATRDLLRRRLPLTRKRAALLAPVPHTTSQDTLPELRQPLAYTAHRAGVAARCPAPAVQKRVEVDRARLASDARVRSDGELTIVQTANQPQAQPLSRRPAVPGLGKRLRLVLRDELHDLARFPRGQAVVSSGRRIKGARASAGKRAGTSGAQIGQASLTWACSDAAGWWLRHTPAGQQDLARVEKHHGTGQA
jgi:hypothetical protein